MEARRRDDNRRREEERRVAERQAATREERHQAQFAALLAATQPNKITMGLGGGQRVDHETPIIWRHRGLVCTSLDLQQNTRSRTRTGPTCSLSSSKRLSGIGRSRRSRTQIRFHMEPPDQAYLTYALLNRVLIWSKTLRGRLMSAGQLGRRGRAALLPYRVSANCSRTSRCWGYRHTWAPPEEC